MTEAGKAKVKRALELQNEISKINAERYELIRRVKQLEAKLEKPASELNEIMKDDYICDKVNGLRMGGIL